MLDTHGLMLIERSVDRETVKGLAGQTAPVCVSIYLHTHREGFDYRKDPIRLKTLLREADRRLGEAGVEEDVIAALLEPARELLDDIEFWQHQRDGLALLLDGVSATMLRATIDFEDLVVVGQRFHLKPLLPLLTGSGVFYVLAIGQRLPRLFCATRDAMREVSLGSAHRRLEDTVGYDWKERTLQSHGAGGSGGQGSVFHGQGGGSESRKREIETFFRAVDREVVRRIGGAGPPLVLVGVDHQTAIYRSVTRYPDVLDRSVSIDPGAINDDELHRRAWLIVEPWFSADRDAAIDRYFAVKRTPRGGRDLDEVLRAAVDGRVDTLFVGVDQHEWGSFESKTRTLMSAHERRPDHEDMVDRVAIESWCRGATVYAVAPGDVPGGGPIAAIYRY